MAKITIGTKLTAGGLPHDMTAEELEEFRRGIDASDAEIARGEFYRFDPSSAGQEAFLEEIRRGGRELAERDLEELLGEVRAEEAGDLRRHTEKVVNERLMGCIERVF